MANDLSSLTTLLSDNALSVAEAKRLVADYPYFAVPAARLVKEGDAGGEEDASLRARVACNVGCVEAIRKAFGSKTEPFYPDRKQEELSTADAIDAFMEVFGKKEDKAELSVAAPSLRELIVSKRYREALEMLEQQNLTNPEKSIYFADQIRYLRKLIINSKHLGN